MSPADTAGERRRWVVVLDDDPTGTQGLTGVPVVLDVAPDTLSWAAQHGDLVYVETNARALDPAPAGEVVRAAVDAALRVAEPLGRQPVFVSRGDSTLRGHFPLEVLAIVAAVEATAQSFSGCLLVPAFPAAGRTTIDGVHHVEVDGRHVPVAETEYATDATFGYRHSRLSEWARERVPSHWAVTEVASEVFDRGLEALVSVLTATIPFSVVCPSVRSEVDLALLARAQLIAEEAGTHLVVHAGPPYPWHLASAVGAGRSSRDDGPGHGTADPPSGEAPHADDDGEQLEPAGTRGLIVVGSHTARTSRQVALGAEQHGLAVIELDAASAAAGGQPHRTELERVVERAAAAMAVTTVVVVTSRQAVTGPGAAQSLEVSRRVASALTEVTRRLLEHAPAFVIAKGGITSHVTVAEALGWRAATVVGPLIDRTLPVWRSWVPGATDDGPQDRPAPQSDRQAGSTRDVEPLCVIFPGNVGAEDLLARALTRLSGPNCAAAPLGDR